MALTLRIADLKVENQELKEQIKALDNIDIYKVQIGILEEKLGEAT